MLIARIVEPEPGEEIYDPACGSGGLLIKCHLRLLERYGEQKNGAVGAQRTAPLRLSPEIAPLKFYGQEINASTFAMARMNAFIHDMEAEISLGDTMARPAFKDDSGRLRQFDIVVANPMWNQSFPPATYEHDPFERFRFGVPPASNADWGWIQHMVASLADGGRMAVVLDAGAVSRGSGYRGSNRERDIRKAFVEANLVEAVLLLPENLFYGATASGIILVINRSKRHPGEVLLINASKLFAKGRPKNFLDDEHIEQIAALYSDWRAEEGVSAIVSKEELARNDYNLSPSRYVAANDAEEVLPLEEAMALLREAEEERAKADRELERVLQMLGLGGLRNEMNNRDLPDVGAHGHAPLRETELGPLPEEWEVVRLGEVAAVDWGNTSLTKSLYKPSGYIAFSAAGPDGFLDFYEQSGEAVIVSAIGARCGKCFYASDQWTAIKNTIVIRGEQADNLFLYFYLDDEHKWPKSGSGQPFISLGKAKNLFIPLPPLPEQRAIAEMLRAVDRKIQAEEQRKAALDALFRTLLHHLMTGKVRVVDAIVGAGSEPAPTAPAPTDMPRVRTVMRAHNPTEGEE